MKLSIGAFLAISLISCSSPGDYIGKDSIDILVENQTGNDLQAVNVFVVQGTMVNGSYREIRTDSSHIGTISDAKIAKGTLSEKMILPNDGSYLLTALDKTGKKHSYGFGYLTNGSFLETAQYITIKRETILVKRL